MSYDLNMNRPTYLKRKLQEFQDKNYSRQPQLMKRLKPFIDKANLIDTEPVLSSPNNPLSKNMDVEPLKKLDKKKRISRINREILFAMK